MTKIQREYLQISVTYYVFLQGIHCLLKDQIHPLHSYKQKENSRIEKNSYLPIWKFSKVNASMRNLSFINQKMQKEATRDFCTTWKKLWMAYSYLIHLSLNFLQPVYLSSEMQGSVLSSVIISTSILIFYVPCMVNIWGHGLSWSLT